VVVTTRSGEAPEGLTRSAARSPTPRPSTPPSPRPRKLGGPVEVVVANAGITKDGLLMRMPDADFDAVIDTNLAGSFRCAAPGERRDDQEALRPDDLHLQRRRALWRARGRRTTAASKSGLVGLARSITRELGGRGITANVVAPGSSRPT
jgi:3-oxoacyl-[acyl-carrier protein] reductase